MDMVDFDPLEESEEDHNLQDYFPEQVPYHLQHLIEYRIRCRTPSQNTLILLNKNLKIYESVLRR